MCWRRVIELRLVWLSIRIDFRQSEKQMTVKKSKMDFCRSWMSYGHVVGLPGSGSGEGCSSEGVGVGGG